MFGGGSTATGSRADNNSAAATTGAVSASPSPISGSDSPDKKAARGNGRSSPPTSTRLEDAKNATGVASGELKRGSGSGHAGPSAREGGATESKKRRASGVSGVSAKASSLIAQAKSTLFSQVGARMTTADLVADSKPSNQTPLQKLGRQDQALAVPQGQHNNAAGESLPGPRSTFRVGVWEDRNKKCRRTMEDTHAFLYNFLQTPAPVLNADGTTTSSGGRQQQAGADASPVMTETDNGYFAIFDGHAGTFAADWCGKKLHIILEEMIRKNPNAPVPELLDQTFTNVDAQLEKLPLKNSGCTAAIAVLRWEDRVPSTVSATGSQAIAPAMAKAVAEEASSKPGDARPADSSSGGSSSSSAPPPSSPSPEGSDGAQTRLKSGAMRQRVLYTANVGDARIVLCRGGKAVRLSYDHKGSDENEGKRISNAGGLILNNRVNGVLAVTRALGDTYMKELVTGHPYTTETVIQPESDEFIVIACDGVWDVCSDQEAVDLVRNIHKPAAAAKVLVDHALAHFSTDNLSCMMIRLDKQALLDHQNNKDAAIGVEGDARKTGGISEAEKIVNATKLHIAEGATPAVGVSASNSGRGHDPGPLPPPDPPGGGGGGSSIGGNREERQDVPFTSTRIDSAVEQQDGKGHHGQAEGGAQEPEILAEPEEMLTPSEKSGASSPRG